VHPVVTRQDGTAESRPSEPELGNTSEGKRETVYSFLKPLSSIAPVPENGFFVVWRIVCDIA
jgi:hypothetical protein